jgi:hypothetical protein
VTSLAIPISERDVWTVRAVGIEDAPDHREKITKPAFFKCSLYGGTAIALAEPFPIHVGVSNTLVCGCRIRLKGNDVVRTGVVELTEIVYLQLYPERPQIDIF